MDGKRFDDVTRALATPRSRRGVLGMLGAALATLVAGRSTDAAPKQDKPSKCYGGGSLCTNGKQCCSGVCTNRECAPETFCIAGSTRSCYTGPEGTAGVGICQAGTQTCLPDGSAFGPCEGEVTPGTETCNGVDENCNGTADDGAVCPPLTNASQICSNGECVFGACNAGFGNCDGDVTNGCETDLLTDTRNCGACDEVCLGGPNAIPTCSGGTCGFVCVTGYSNCTGSVADGCTCQTPAVCGAAGCCTPQGYLPTAAAPCCFGEGFLGFCL